MRFTAVERINLYLQFAFLLTIASNYFMIMIKILKEN